MLNDRNRIKDYSARARSPVALPKGLKSGVSPWAGPVLKDRRHEKVPEMFNLTVSFSRTTVKGRQVVCVCERERESVCVRESE